MSTHLVKNQKMTKRQIKEDSLVTAAFRATEIWERYGWLHRARLVRELLVEL